MKSIAQFVVTMSFIVVTVAVGAMLTAERRKAMRSEVAALFTQKRSKVEDQKPAGPFRVGTWVRHKDGSLGLVEEARGDGTYRIRTELDLKDDKASWYDGSFWKHAYPKAREWWRHKKTGVVSQSSEDWPPDESDEEFAFEPVNWGRG